MVGQPYTRDRSATYLPDFLRNNAFFIDNLSDEDEVLFWNRDAELDSLCSFLRLRQDIGRYYQLMSCRALGMGL